MRVIVTLNAHFDGKTLVPDEPLSLPVNQKLRVTVEPVSSPTEIKDRVPGLHRGALLYISPDFRRIAGLS